MYQFFNKQSTNSTQGTQIGSARSEAEKSESVENTPRIMGAGTKCRFLQNFTELCDNVYRIHRAKCQNIN